MVALRCIDTIGKDPRGIRPRSLGYNSRVWTANVSKIFATVARWEWLSISWLQNIVQDIQKSHMKTDDPVISIVTARIFLLLRLDSNSEVKSTKQSGKSSLRVSLALSKTFKLWTRIAGATEVVTTSTRIPFLAKDRTLAVVASKLWRTYQETLTCLFDFQLSFTTIFPPPNNFFRPSHSQGIAFGATGAL